MNDLNPEEQRKSTELIARFNAFDAGESHDCPFCRTPVTSAELYAKYEPEMFSLYVFPCGCRLGLWSKAPSWITNVRVIEVDDPNPWEARRRLKRWNDIVRGKQS